MNGVSEVRDKRVRSPAFSSTDEMTVPAGFLLIGLQFPHCQLRLGCTMHELARVGVPDCHDQFLPQLELVSVPEHDSD